VDEQAQAAQQALALQAARHVVGKQFLGYDFLIDIKDFSASDSRSPETRLNLSQKSSPLIVRRFNGSSCAAASILIKAAL
jgi:hypothetical protein